MDTMPKALIYADGACSGNPGPGGWAAIVKTVSETRYIRGGSPSTTNNRMELTAVINGIRSLTGMMPYHIKVVSDSKYVIDAFQRGWLDNWKARNWPNANPDLWQELDVLVSQHRCEWEWVKGHNGEPLNEAADRLACEQRDLFIRGEGSAEPTVTAVPRQAKSPAATEAKADIVIPGEVFHATQQLLNMLGAAETGTERPCGQYDWCELCQGEEKDACAKAFFRQTIAVQKD